MKTTHLWIYFSVLFVTVSHAQSFAPSGAKWCYTRGKISNLNTMELVNDTLIEGLLFKKIKVVSYRSLLDKRLECYEYLHGNQDSILYFNYYHQKIFKLYDFTKDSGETVVVHAGRFKPTDAFQLNLWQQDSIDGFKYRVGKIDSILINQQNTRRQSISYIDDFGSWRIDTRGITYIIPGIGSTGYFFGSYIGASVADDDDILRCYSDSTAHYKNPFYQIADCDVISGISESNKDVNVQIYPNPFNSELTITFSDGTFTCNRYEIKSISGQLLLSGALNQNTTTVITSSLTAGIYFFNILNKQNQPVKTIKINKQ